MHHTRTIIALVLVVLLAGCAQRQTSRSTDLASPTQTTDAPSTHPTPPAGAVEGSGNTVVRFLPRGGRVDWYKGAAHSLIAYDAIVDDTRVNTELFTIEPDGSDQRCVTCDAPIPKGFVGQPAWHPDGEFLVIQAENENSQHRLYNHMAWGINNDLWLIKRDGTSAERIWRTPLNNAALHPHFSEDGTKLIFAERIATNRPIIGLRRITPGGENPWAGWQIHIADFNPAAEGEAKLTNHRTLTPNGSGFYEIHDLTAEGQIEYSFTPGGEAYVDDTYTSNVDGTDVRNLINSPDTWDEHGTYSPSERTLAFVSSRMDRSWRAPRSRANTLRTELFTKDPAGTVTQITAINQNGDPNQRYLVSDFSWDREGRRIVFQVATLNADGLPLSPELWMVTFAEPQ
jgi:Tol biopolymer transport system component